MIPSVTSSLLHLFTYSLTRSLSHSFTHSLTHLLTLSLTHLLTRLLTYSSLTHSFTHLLIHSLTHSLTHLLPHSHSMTRLVSYCMPWHPTLLLFPHCFYGIVMYVCMMCDIGMVLEIMVLVKLMLSFVNIGFLYRKGITILYE